MNEPGFSRFSSSHHHLDPGALEFFPSAPPPPPIPYPLPPLLPVSIPPVSPAPTRTLLLSMVPATVSESTVRRELEIFGDVRAVQMERRREGLVTVHFYDLRDAQAALAAIQDQHMQHQYRVRRHYDAVLNHSMAFMPPPPPPLSARGLISGRVVWAHFVAPVTSGLPDGTNQGSLVIFHLNPGVSATYLKQIFEAFGPVKELRETPNKRNQRFVEFYDVRNAAKAMAGMTGKEICGRPIVVEFSRPGGQRRPINWRAPLTKPNNPCPNNNYPSTNSPRRFPVTAPPAVSRPPPAPAHRNYECRRNPNGSDGSKSWSSESSNHGSDLQKKKSNSQKKMNKSSPTSDSGGSGTSKGGRWKGGGGGGGGGGGRRQVKDHDGRFLINEDAIVESNCRDSRTTVMIKNIPNKYSQKLLLNMLDNHCIHCNEQIGDGDDQPLSSYDFVYLPIDFINKCNVGYGFVNMTSPEATLRLYKAFHHQNWEVFNSRKICEVTYARLQGLDALRDHFKSSKFPGDAEEYMPVIFSPPRDGLIQPDPLPIIGRDTSSSSSSSQSKKSDSPPKTDGGAIHNASCDDDEDEDDYGVSQSYDENE